MNLVNSYIFTPPITYNTYIGGISSSVSSATLLASKLGISVGAISNFAIVGSDIKCKITGSYEMPLNCWYNNSTITYFKDNDGLVSKLNGASFSTNANLELLEFPNCTAAIGGGGGSWLFYSSPKIKIIYIPRCSNLGGTAGNDSLTAGVATGCKFYLPISLQTNNGGSPDGDIAGLGSDVVYVSNFTAPNAITDLSAGTIYNSAIQLNFIPPSSTNAIDYYELYQNGVFLKNITAAGQYITGLTASTSYTFTVVAVDIFYNKSVVSNSLVVSTNNVEWLLVNLVGNYHLESNSNDSSGLGNNGTDTSITYSAGKINNAAVFNGSTSKIQIAYNSSLDMSPNVPFSVSMWIKWSSVTDTEMICCSNGSSRVWEFEKTGGTLRFRINNGTSTSIRMEKTYSFTPTAGAYYMVTATYSGNASPSGMSLYLNGSSVGTGASIGGTYSAMGSNTNPLVIGTFPGYSPFTLNGQIDELCIWKNRVLTQTDIDLLYNNGNGTTL